MLNKSNFISNLCFLIMALISFYSCQEKEECSKFNHEVYLDEPKNTLLMEKTVIFRDTLLQWFNETPI